MKQFEVFERSLAVYVIVVVVAAAEKAAVEIEQSFVHECFRVQMERQ